MLWKSPFWLRRCSTATVDDVFELICGFSWQACVCGYPIATGAATRLVSGYDSYGNTCGRDNAKIEGVPLSGRDMQQNK